MTFNFMSNVFRFITFIYDQIVNLIKVFIKM